MREQNVLAKEDIAVLFGNVEALLQINTSMLAVRTLSLCIYSDAGCVTLLSVDYARENTHQRTRLCHASSWGYIVGLSSPGRPFFLVVRVANHCVWYRDWMPTKNIAPITEKPTQSLSVHSLRNLRFGPFLRYIFAPSIFF